MFRRRPRITRLITLCAATAILASCGLPRSGPTKNEIFKGSVERQGNAFVVSVDDRVAEVTRQHPGGGFSAALINAGSLGSDTIRPGDTLGLTIYENVDDGLLVPTGQNATVLEEVQVDGSGFIFVPYAGRVRAAGNTPEGIRRLITTRLEEMTPEPQVQVARVAGDGSTVSVAGGVGSQGVYPIQQPTRTLTSMLARAGGIAVDPEVAQVTVVRGEHRGTIWFQDLYEDPHADIALRAGDRILVEEDTRSFTALGATGAQDLIPFTDRTISAIEAIAQVGGLNPSTADPTGVFVFRNEPEVLARQLTGIPDLVGTQRMVYILDLTRPNGMFFARDFAIRDEDTVYVTEAPIVQYNRLISALTGTLGAVARVQAASD